MPADTLGFMPRSSLSALENLVHWENLWNQTQILESLLGSTFARYHTGPLMIVIPLMIYHLFRKHKKTNKWYEITNVNKKKNRGTQKAKKGDKIFEHNLNFSQV